MINYKILDDSIKYNPFYYKSEKGLLSTTKKEGTDKNCKHLKYKKTNSTSVITVIDHFKCNDCGKEINIDYGY